eukprot:CAMPEP_0179080708 /NCGR_PEP_ID=MMETSP0796-20121207/36288_1 /TAXON_ID=73915 /ORGANISM="Pyrodinium bahamense, Strain pbaha01" /LENGTH=74 /DNA_ID=CAMNT_0020778065 /DNA_START=26 /DNA_END=248 /DNA_ORIENTATION=+
MNFKIPRTLNPGHLLHPSHNNGSLIDQRIGEKQHERDDQAVNRQGLHEGQRQQQHAPEVIGDLGLPADAIDATA